jgi:ubiquinone/menaquinone biosynthesis C-methylase UbiE
MYSSTEYYDKVAAEYDSHMTATDQAVRRLVEKIFAEKINGGFVLDFGGGTGLDLPWLLKKGYSVYFLEPSSNMRSIAKEALKGLRIKPVIVERQIDFHSWSERNLPFTEKMQAILANFAVLNCIPDIECLFEKLAMVCASRCLFLATVLNTKPSRLLKSHSFPVAVKGLLNRKLVSRNEFKGVNQETFLHHINAYKSACRKHFDFLSCKPVPFSDFAILTLYKK